MLFDYKTVHDACGWHEELVRKSQKCGCFYCLRIFNADEIDEWIEDGPNCPRGPGKTALCPYCLIDSVIPDAAVSELTEILLREMNRVYFS